MSLDRRPDSMERITTPEQAQVFIDEQLAELREQIGDKKVLLDVKVLAFLEEYSVRNLLLSSSFLQCGLLKNGR